MGLPHPRKIPPSGLSLSVERPQYPRT
jgi:hypothetical protein